MNVNLSMFDIIRNPSVNKNDNLSNLHYMYHSPMRQNRIVINHSMMALLEAIASESVTQKLRIVPRDLRQIMFITFHSNPIGGHFGVNSTVVRIRLRLFWPRLFTYVKEMIGHCASCKLANAKCTPSSELVYNFLIDNQ